MKTMLQYMVSDPLALGTEYKMGAHKTTYQPRTLTRQDAIFLIVLTIVFFLMTIIIATLTQELFVFVLYLLYWILIAVIVYLDNSRKKGLRMFLYEDGLIHIGRRLSITSIYWRHVQSLIHKEVEVSTESSLPTTTHFYILKCIDGTSLKLNSNTFFELALPMPLLEQEITRSLFPTALKMYQIGHPVAFGPLTVMQEGLHYKKRFFSWHMVKSISDTGSIKVLQEGKRGMRTIKIFRAKVPNFEVLRMLIQHILSELPPESL